MLVHAPAYSFSTVHFVRRQSGSVFKVLKNLEELGGIRMNLDEFRKLYKNFKEKTSLRSTNASFAQFLEWTFSFPLSALGACDHL